MDTLANSVDPDEMLHDTGTTPGSALFAGIKTFFAERITILFLLITIFLHSSSHFCHLLIIPLQTVWIYIRSGSKLFDTCKIYLKNYLIKTADDKKHAKLPSFYNAKLNPFRTRYFSKQGRPSWNATSSGSTLFAKTKSITKFLKIITCDHSIYTMDHPDLTVSIPGK